MSDELTRVREYEVREYTRRRRRPRVDRNGTSEVPFGDGRYPRLETGTIGDDNHVINTLVAVSSHGSPCIVSYVRHLVA
jgi:hypothetical protein